MGKGQRSEKHSWGWCEGRNQGTDGHEETEGIEKPNERVSRESRLTHFFHLLLSFKSSGRGLFFTEM